MALRFFSRLFGGSKNEEEPEEMEDEVQEQEPEEPVDDLSDTILELPQDHALFRLWDYRKQNNGWMPPPQLQLTGSPDCPRVLSSGPPWARRT